MPGKIALVIGNWRYNSARPLSNCGRDAQVISDALKSLGFDFICTEDGDIHHENSDGMSMRRLIADFSVKADSAELAFFYYAGHGVELAGDNYLLPVDAHITHVRRLFLEAISLTDLRRVINARNNRVIVLDACRGNPFPQPMRGDDNVGSAYATPKTIKSHQNEHVIFSAAPGQPADDGPKGGNGPFAPAFVKSLGLNLPINDCVFETARLMGADEGGRQAPQIYSQATKATYLSSAPARQKHDSDIAVSIDCAIHTGEDNLFRPGDGKRKWLKDLEIGPEMVCVPAGRFNRGLLDERGRHAGEVVFRLPFLISRFPVTVAQWRAAQSHPMWPGAVQAPSFAPPAEFKEDNCPMTYIDWEHANAYARWLSSATGKDYRLPSETEWEYCCRAGSSSEYCTGDRMSSKLAYYGQENSSAPPRPVESYDANAWGLYQVHGNIWEWVVDSWQRDYSKSPNDGTAWISEDARKVLRGGGRFSKEAELRSGYRKEAQTGLRLPDRGFRVVRSLDIS